MTQNSYFYEPKNGHQLKHNPFKAIIAPRPIGWISTRSQDGIDNLAPYSFFNAFSDNPPILGFVSCGWKDSAQNIKETGIFGWNLVTESLAKSMNFSSKSVAPNIDEFTLSELTKVESKIINVSRVKESPVSFECKLTQILKLNNAEQQELNSWLFLGEVVGVHIDNRLIQNGIYHTLAGNPVMRAGGPGTYFRLSETDQFELIRPDDK